MDYFLKYDVEISLLRKILLLNIRNRKIVLPLISDEHSTNFNVHVAHSVTIPPHSKRRIIVHVNSPSRTMSFQPLHRFSMEFPIYFSSSSLRVDKFSSYLLVVNRTDRPYFLSRGLTVGLATDCSDERHRGSTRSVSWKQRPNNETSHHLNTVKNTPSPSAHRINHRISRESHLRS